jgi:hypothetical protein
MSVAFSPTGDRVVVAGTDEVLTIVRVSDGGVVETLEGRRSMRFTSTSVAWSSRDAIAAAGEDGVHLWTMQGGHFAPAR